MKAGTGTRHGEPRAPNGGKLQWPCYGGYALFLPRTRRLGDGYGALLARFLWWWLGRQPTMPSNTLPRRARRRDPRRAGVRTDRHDDARAHLPIEQETGRATVASAARRRKRALGTAESGAAFDFRSERISSSPGSKRTPRDALNSSDIHKAVAVLDHVHAAMMLMRELSPPTLGDHLPANVGAPETPYLARTVAFTDQASGALRGALVGGMPASNRACRVVPTETRRHSLHRYKPSCGADAESPACGISGKGRGLNSSVAHRTQYSVVSIFYQLDCKPNSRLRSACSRRVSATSVTRPSHTTRGTVLTITRG